jgi:hypothetical protein
MTELDKLTWLTELQHAFEQEGLPEPELEVLENYLMDHAYVHCLGTRVYLAFATPWYHVRRPASDGPSFDFVGSTPTSLPEAIRRVAQAFKEHQCCTSTPTGD